MRFLEKCPNGSPQGPIGALFAFHRDQGTSQLTAQFGGQPKRATDVDNIMLKELRSGPRPVDVLALRKRMQLTRKQFAGRFGFSVAALRYWERGERKPRGPALTLLAVISRNPRAVLMALRQPVKMPCSVCQAED